MSLVAIVLAYFHFRADGVTEPDALFHIGASKLLLERGIVRQFEWTQLTILKDRFADHYLLFHAALIPFCGSLEGAKAFAVLMGLSVFAALAFVLRGQRVTGIWIWVLVLLASSIHWMFRLVMVRPHVASIALLFLGVHWLLKGRWKPLAALAFAYAWTYPAAHVLLVAAVIVTVSRRLFEGTWEWRPLAAAAGGLAGGMLLNPYFPNNLVLWWIQNPVVLSKAWGISSGIDLPTPSELWPIDAGSIIKGSPLALLVFAGANVAAARAKLSGESKSVLILAWAFLVLYLLSSRFVEYFVPFSVLAGAMAHRDLPAMRIRRVPVAALMLASLAWVLWGSDRLIVPQVRWEAGASAWIRANIPAGRTIAHLDFDQFAPLFWRDRDHLYLTGLDPMYSYASHPYEALYLERLSSMKEPINPWQLSVRTGSNVLVLQKSRHGWQAAMLQQARARCLYDDPYACVFELIPD